MHTSVSVTFSEFFTSLHLQFSTLCTFFIYLATMAALNLAALRQQVNTDDSNESVVNSIVRRLTLPRFRANGQFDEVLNRINTFTAVVATLPDLNNGQPTFHYGKPKQNIRLPLSFMQQQDGEFDCAMMASSR
eukprot:832268_1